MMSRNSIFANLRERARECSKTKALEPVRKEKCRCERIELDFAGNCVCKDCGRVFTNTTIAQKQDVVVIGLPYLNTKYSKVDTAEKTTHLLSKLSLQDKDNSHKSKARAMQYRYKRMIEGDKKYPKPTETSYCTLSQINSIETLIGDPKQSSPIILNDEIKAYAIEIINNVMKGKVIRQNLMTSVTAAAIWLSTIKFKIFFRKHDFVERIGISSKEFIKGIKIVEQRSEIKSLALYREEDTVNQLILSSGISINEQDRRKIIDVANANIRDNIGPGKSVSTKCASLVTYVQARNRKPPVKKSKPRRKRKTPTVN